MATWDEVSRTCLALPLTTELVRPDGLRSWRVKDKAFVWERPLRRTDIDELGDAAPSGPVLAAHVPDEGAKTALVTEEPDVYFTTHHFDGYSAPQFLEAARRFGKAGLMPADVIARIVPAG